MTETNDLFARSPSILRMPSWLGPEAHEEHELQFEPGDYKVTPGEGWTVVPRVLIGCTAGTAAPDRWEGRLRVSEFPYHRSPQAWTVVPLT
jgi:hypothetical protein